MIKIYTSTLFLALSCSISAQLIVENSQNTSNYIQNVLLGAEVPVINLIVNGTIGNIPSESIGEFTCDNCAIDIEHGLLLSTGSVLGAIGPNNVANQSYNLNSTVQDDDMNSIATDLQLSSINDLTVIEFDFVAFSPTLDIEIVWASEEYDSYVNSQYNDFFGAFLSGPGITGPFLNNAVNLSLVPGTESPIGVTNINNGYDNAGPCANCEYYNQYESDNYLFSHPNDTHFSNPYYSQYDGWTVPLHLTHPLVCGETYHLKLAIADASDNSMDSGVFIRNRINSYGEAVLISTQFSDMQDSDNQFFESCNIGSITFYRPTNAELNDDFVIDLTYGGDAISGVDYVELPNQVIIPAGETSLTIPVEIIADGVNEDIEILTLNLLYQSSCLNEGVIPTYDLYISDTPSEMSILDQSPLVCANNQNFIIAIVEGGSSNYSYSWDDGSTSDTLFYSTPQDTTFTVTITDNCTGMSTSNTFDVNIFFQVPMSLDIVDTDNLLPIICNEFGSIYVLSSGGVVPYFFEYSSPNVSFTSPYIDQFWINAENVGMNYITLTDYCGLSITDSIYVEVEIDEISISMPDTITYHCGENITAFVDVNYVGEYESTLAYSWYLDNTIIFEGNDSISQLAFGNHSLWVGISGECSPYVSAQTELVMLPFDPATSNPNYETICQGYYGCMDINACNYSSEALIDDATCIYEIPSSVITGSVVAGNSSLFNYTYSSSSNGNIQWSITNGEIISGQGTNEITVQWSDAGIGSLSAQEIIGDCSSDPTTLEIEVLSVGENYSSIVRIYPVPTSDHLNIQLDETWIMSQFEITDETGRMVDNGICRSKNTLIQTNHMAHGHYQITIKSTNGEIAHRRFLVMD